MSKKISFGTQPRPAPEPVSSADAWVDHQSTTEEMKRLTIDIPASLHKRIKMTCAERDVKMADAIRELLHTHFDGA